MTSGHLVQGLVGAQVCLDELEARQLSGAELGPRDPPGGVEGEDSCAVRL